MENQAEIIQLRCYFEALDHIGFVCGKILILKLRTASLTCVEMKMELSNLYQVSMTGYSQNYMEVIHEHQN